MDWINPKNAPYNAAWDGVADDTAAVRAATVDAMAQGRPLCLPAGTGCVGATGGPLDPDVIVNVAAPLRIIGAGAHLTRLKSIVSHSTLIGSYIGGLEVSDLTLDANGSEKTALRCYGQQPTIRNVIIENQGGILTPALLLDGATQARVEAQLRNCATGVEVGRQSPTYYPKLDIFVSDCTSGPALKMRGVVGAKIDAYFEAAPVSPLDIEGCDDIHFEWLESELADIIALTESAYVRLHNNGEIRFRGGRINHSGTSGKALFKLTGNNANINWRDFYTLTTRPDMTMFRIEGSARKLAWRDQRSFGVSSYKGIDVGNTMVNQLTVDQWDSGGTPCTHTINAWRPFLKNIDDNFYIDNQGAGGALMGCSGNITGPAASTIARLG